MIIKESGMVFGPFKEEQVFHIEQSSVYKKIKNGIPMAEFLFYDDLRKRLIVIEAKSSTPNPTIEESKEKFDDFMDHVVQKLINALAVGTSLKIGRLHDQEDELTDLFRTLPLNSIKIHLLLVVNKYDEKWMPDLNDAFNSRLRGLKRIWNIEAMAINDRGAKKLNLIS